MSLIYVKHPVSKQQKAKLQSLGKIVDARFAPKGAEIFDADGVSQAKPKPTPRMKSKAAD